MVWMWHSFSPTTAPQTAVAGVDKRPVASTVGGTCLNGNGACHRTPLPPVDVDWTGVANDWWPGYQVGTCIYEGCSGGKWILGAIGAWPGGKAVTGTSLLARGALSATGKNLLRVAATDIWRARMGRSAAEMGLEVHHRIPLEWAHLSPNLDPNRAANLIGVPAAEHWRITAAWNQWRVNLGGRVPTQAELEGFASGIDMAFFDVMTRLP